MEAIITALAKVKNDLERARSEAADLREELHGEQVKNMELKNQLETTEMERQRLVIEVGELRDSVHELQTEKRQVGERFKNELRDLLY